MYNCNVYSKQNEVRIVMFIAVILILHTIAVFLFYNMDTSDAHNEVTLDRSICII